MQALINLMRNSSPLWSVGSRDNLNYESLRISYALEQKQLAQEYLEDAFSLW